MREEPPGSRYITPQQTLSVVRRAGLDEKQLALPGMAVLTFSRAVMDRLEQLCGLEDAEWLSALYHPYAAARIIRRGTYQGLGVTALVPPMGPSPLACIVEDLAACGVGAVFLVCAAWSLGPPVRMCDLIVPAFSMGPDGTSIHYGNTSGHVAAEPLVVEALVAACRERTATVHVGGNGSCEALYRITPRMADGFRRRGCLCMDNGEASSLLAVTQMLGVLGGVIFQPYIELERGWEPAVLRDERYRTTCHRQADAALECGILLHQRGLLTGRVPALPFAA
jgi:uridine phosphorylase